MDKKYEIPECEEIKMMFENNIMSTQGETPDMPGYEG